MKKKSMKKIFSTLYNLLFIKLIVLSFVAGFKRITGTQEKIMIDYSNPDSVEKGLKAAGYTFKAPYVKLSKSESGEEIVEHVDRFGNPLEDAKTKTHGAAAMIMMG